MRRIILDALGLTPKEQKVLNVLRSFALAQNETKIAREAELPRTTTAFILRKLEERKLAQRVRSFNRFVWKYRKNLDILDSAEKDGNSLTSSFSFSPSSSDSLISIVNGMSEILKELLKILDISSAGRLYAIQGSKISKNILKKVDYKFLSSFHQELKRRDIIIEGVIAESVYKLFGSMTTSQLESHLDRMTVVHVLSDELIDFPLDIFFVKDYILLVDYETERLVRIDDGSLLLAFKSLFFLAEQYGKKIDLNKHIRELLEKKSE